MSEILSTGYQLKTNGSIQAVDLTDKTKWVSGRVRWKGIETTLNDYQQNVGYYPPNNSTTYPYKGRVNFDNHFISALVTMYNPTGSTLQIRTFLSTAEGTFYSTYVDIGPYETKQIFATPRYEYGYHAGSTVIIAGQSNPVGATVTSAVVGVSTSSHVVVKTTNPSITIGGYTYNHVGTLDADVESNWYNIANGFTAGQINNVLNNFDSSSRAYVDIEYTVEPKLPLNTITAPSHGTRTSDYEIDFIFKLDEDTDNSATKYHARIRFDDFSTMLSPDVYESKDEQDDWYYWDGNDWLAFPSAGVDPDTIVKYIKMCNLGQWYWDIASWDDYGYGYVGSAYKFKVTINVTGPYILNIGGGIYEGNYKAFELSVVETSNGEIGTILATIDNSDVTADLDINYGDSVAVAFLDASGNQEEFMGVVREKIPNGFNLTVIAILGDGILAERIVKEDYIKQDVGLIAKKIIDTYCSPLTSDNIDTSTGFEAPIPADGKKALAVFEDIRKNYGLFYYVDIDWDVHLYGAADIIEEPIIEIRYGD